MSAGSTDLVSNSATPTTFVPAAADGTQAVVDGIIERADAVDRGDHDVRTGVRALGEAGLLDLGCDTRDTGDTRSTQKTRDTRDTRGTRRDAGDDAAREVRADDLTAQGAVLREVARHDMATAFAAWAQRMAIGYLVAWGTGPLNDEFLPQLVSGERAGATAMATAFQDALGLKELSVTARFDGNDVVLDGVIPWASNLFDGAVVILPARTDDGRRLIAAVTTDLDGVRRAPQPQLLALSATASTTLFLDEVRIPRSWVLTDEFLVFLSDVRPGFLLLQTAFCLGISDAALAGSAGRFTGPAEVLAADHDELAARRDALSAAHGRLLAKPRGGDEVVRIRLEAGRLGVDTVRHEATVRGGAGYLASSPTARRLREAAFLPIQSPTEAQLRWELTRSA